MSFFINELFFSFRRLLTSEELIHFDRIRVFLDEDFENSERFTVRSTFIDHKNDHCFNPLEHSQTPLR